MDFLSLWYSSLGWSVSCFFYVFWGVVLEGGGQKTTTGLQILFLGGVETTTSFEGGVQKKQGGCSFVSRMW